MAPITVSVNKALMKKVALGYNKTVRSKKAKALRASSRTRRLIKDNKNYSAFIDQFEVVSDIDKE